MYMELAVFEELTQEITTKYFFMTEYQQEEKVIQLIDLHHFVQCLDSNIKVIDYLHHSINIIEQDGLSKGILFYDMKNSSFPDCNTSEEFKKRYGLSELWFVFVEEDFSGDKDRHSDFIIENSLEIFYDKIFLFHFFQTSIHRLK